MSTENPADIDSASEQIYSFSMWKKIILLGAGVLLVAGAITRVSGSGSEASNLKQVAGVEAGSRGEAGSTSSSLTGASGDSSLLGEDIVLSEPKPDAPWSPALFRGGFGLFLGFGVGLVLRLFVKAAALVTGVTFILISLLAYIGWVEVHWDVMEEQASRWFSLATDQFESFRKFLTGHLPSTALTGLGMFAGFRRS